ncbi:RHS repeat-associated core domain-containing protein [Pontimicrobium sp. SW4]|uniref:RHS repeat-associated core domain-containing protein n=1 Tax=Pontimicrobium sp. SW4 TaxID=3153519 RepID=A0AAU7BQA2_9FLAO
MKHIYIYILFLVSLSVLNAQENPPTTVDDMNWISNISYDFNGNTVAKGISFFNTLGKSTQSQSWDIITDSIWASQTLYDYQGRPAFQSLSAPTGSVFGYLSSFINNTSGSPYTRADFDDSGTLLAPNAVGSQPNTLGWYYSNSNTSEPYQDITSHPFSRTVYSKLNPGAVLKTLGGNKVNIGGVNQWANGYTFSMPAAQEMYYAFGKDYFPDGETILYPTSASVNAAAGVYECSVKSCSTNVISNNIIVDVPEGFNLIQGKVYQFHINGVTSYYTLMSAMETVDPYNEEGENPMAPPPPPNSIILAPAYDTCPVGPIYNLKVTKSVSRDVHGVETVVFVDSDGNTLAAARSGNEDNPTQKKYNVMSPIGEQGFVDIHIPVGCGGAITFKGNTSATFNVFDLITEAKLNTSPITSSNYTLNPGMYRVAEVTSYHKNPLPFVIINGSTIDLIDNTNQVGVSYDVNYYDYSLNFYDKAGRLTQSVQPQGFDDALTLSTSVRNHDMSSTFAYNTLGQLLSTTSPDEGAANFKYRKDGQIRFSQNVLQATNNEFSYTNYDDLGRPIESGVLSSNSFATADPDSAVLPAGTKKEQHFTIYDSHDIPAGVTPPSKTLDQALTDMGLTTLEKQQYIAKFLASNVAITYTKSPETTTTWYSYDIYGRVKWIVQYINGLGTKTIDYEYDFAKGHVTKVIYQKYNANELFIHRYNYNSAGQLTSVATSTDNTAFILQESYTYYENGALKRKELLKDAIQGTDYVYNLNGQLKAINHPSLSPTQDPGGDTDDAFGMLIDYHQNDYARTQRSNITTTPFGTDQFNGNIKTTRWNTHSNALTAPSENAYNYEYNKNNWLQAADYGENIIGNTTNTNLQANISSTAVTASGNILALEATNSITLSPGFHAQTGSGVTAKIYTLSSFDTQNTGDYDVTSITYDANGNIKTLNRNKNTESGSNAMDEFTYDYITGKNQLDYVQDAVTGTTNADDLKTQATGNYVYNSIGQLIEDHEEAVADPTNIVRYIYNTSGLVTEVSKKNVPLVKFFYNDKGHRVKKEIYTAGSLTNTDYYVRDAAGSVMAIYNGNTLKEQPIYGSSRIGVYNRQDSSTAYQLTDHLGNVRAVISKDSNNNMLMLSYTDYYPGGMAMPGRNVVGDYRYDYQGQEKDRETGKNAFTLRLYDARINRWIAPDPYGEFFSPYLAMGNNWLNRIDPTGGMTDCPDCPDPPIATILLDEVVITASRGDTWIKGAAPVAVGLEHASWVRNNFYVPNDRFYFEGFKRGELSQMEYALKRYDLQGEARSRMTRSGQAVSELAKSRRAQMQTAHDFATGKKEIRVEGKGNTNTRNFGVKGTLLKGASRATIVYGVYSTVEHIHSAEDKGLAISQEAGGWAGAWGGAKAGALIGSAFGPVGTLVGGLIGGAVGYAAGYSAGGAIYREFD